MRRPLAPQRSLEPGGRGGHGFNLSPGRRMSMLDLRERRGEEMGRSKGWLRRVVGDFVRRLREHDLMMMAAAIAFYWLLGIVPLLLLGSSILGYVLGSSERGADEVMAMASRMIPRATGREVEEFLRSLIQSRYVTGVLGVG
ncbi:MAG: hypothetical protein EHM71_11955, partial [Zetaproteobacteria bacterium]